MNENYKVSVVIPVYNSEKFLRDSLESVLNQTYSDIEIIVINDGSTDNSLAILKQYNEKIIIVDQKNMGLANALNMGIQKMSGNWLKWFSPDDILYPDSIQILIDAAKKLPKNTILYSNWIMIDKNSKKLREFKETNYNSINNFDFNVRLLDGQQINVNTTLIPKTLLDSGCKLRNLDDLVAIDYDFFLRSGIFFNTKFYLIEKNLLKYRIHEKQLSHQNITNSIKFIENLKNQILTEMEAKTMQDYLIALEKYQKTKPIIHKILSLGLEIFKDILPDNIPDKLIMFYLNKIRQRR